MANKSIKQVYDRHCQRHAVVTDPNRKPTPSFKPSMVGSPCLRKIFYSYNKVSEDYGFPLDKARIAELGTAIGEMVAKAMYYQSVGIKFRKPDGTFYKNKDGSDDFEFRLEFPEIGIKLAKVDLVLILDDGLWLGEVKSINAYGYSPLERPKDDHMIQGVLYLYLFNVALREGRFAHIPELAQFTKANGVRFLYYGKDTSNLKEYIVTTADELFKSIVTKMEQVKWFSEQAQLPPKTEDYCKSCNWRLKCENNQKSD